jgi:hypothetical protein
MLNLFQHPISRAIDRFTNMPDVYLSGMTTNSVMLNLFQHPISRVADRYNVCPAFTCLSVTCRRTPIRGMLKRVQHDIFLVR